MKNLIKNIDILIFFDIFSITNAKMDQPIQVASTCIQHAIILFLRVQNPIMSDIPHQLVKVFIKNIRSQEVMCQWIHHFCKKKKKKKRHDAHNLACEQDSHLLLTSDSITRIHALLTDDR